MFLILVISVQPFVSIVRGYSSWEVDRTATVSRVIDGDTFDTTSGDRVRLADIDAPERGEPGYYEAKDFLTSLVGEKMVYLDIDDVYVTDRYGRLVCVVYVDYNQTHYENVNKALLAEGYVVISNYNNEFNPFAWVLYVSKNSVPEFPLFSILPVLMVVAVLMFVTHVRSKNATKALTRVSNERRSFVIGNP